MRVETLHAPGGKEIDPYTCPLCFAEFDVLFLFNKHVREKHPESAKAGPK